MFIRTAPLAFGAAPIVVVIKPVPILLAFDVDVMFDDAELVATDMFDDDDAVPIILDCAILEPEFDNVFVVFVGAANLTA